jgi:hypothetical protein
LDTFASTAQQSEFWPRKPVDVRPDQRDRERFRVPCHSDGLLMSFVLQPWQVFFVTLAAWVSHRPGRERPVWHSEPSTTWVRTPASPMPPAGRPLRLLDQLIGQRRQVLGEAAVPGSPATVPDWLPRAPWSRPPFWRKDAARIYKMPYLLVELAERFGYIRIREFARSDAGVGAVVRGRVKALIQVRLVRFCGGVR